MRVLVAKLNTTVGRVRRQIRWSGERSRPHDHCGSGACTSS